MPNSKLKIKNFEFLISTLCILFFLSSCESGLIRKQEEQLRLQQEEILLQRREIKELIVARQKEEKKRQDCNRAFGQFEKAQASKNVQDAVLLYRAGLTLCPDDDVAHYELGKILQRMGETQGARQEYEAALRINPNFKDAKRQLESMQTR